MNVKLMIVPRDIIVYSDEGVSPSCLKHLIKSLQGALYPKHYRIRRLSAKQVISMHWEKNSDLFIIPGGQDVYYQRQLGDAGTKKIQHFVEQGGGYLGICAGAYFASNDFEFEKGGELELVQKRDLGFFPGRAVGPALGLNEYKPLSEAGARAALVSVLNESFYTYYNGGCLFENASSYPQVEVLGRFDHLENNPAAIVSCDFGKGKCILSGVHIEWSPFFISNRLIYPRPFFSYLVDTEDKRKMMFKELLSRLKIHVSKN